MGPRFGHMVGRGSPSMPSDKGGKVASHVNICPSRYEFAMQKSRNTPGTCQRNVPRGERAPAECFIVFIISPSAFQLISV